MADGAASVRALCEIAAERGLRVDLHCDETDDPLSRHIETLAYETQRLGLQGRVAGSHLTSMHSMDNYYVSKLLPLMAEAGVAAIANPLINIVIQGRHDTYPKRRGMTRIPEMRAHGILCAFGHDCVMDPWYSLGSGDMLEVASMAVHVGAHDEPRRHALCFDGGDREPGPHHGARGLRSRRRLHGDLVLLQAARPDRGDPAQGDASRGGPSRPRHRRGGGTHLAPPPRRAPRSGRRCRLCTFKSVNVRP